MISALISSLAFLADWLLGDPQNWPHPVRFIGHIISNLENSARHWARGNPARLRLAGIFLVIICLAITMGLVGLLLFLTASIWKPLYYLLALYFVYSGLCLKDLYKQSWAVEEALSGDNKAGPFDGALPSQSLEEARKRLSWIVGRDTRYLDEPAIRRATIETLAENLSDGIVAPLFYLALGGPILMWAYKAINTMDSMIAYKNDKYINLGYFAAKLDDVFNFIPARLAALLIVLSAYLLKYNWHEALTVWLRDNKNHSSPNAGHPEAAMAGALNIFLGGPSYYEGHEQAKPFINEGAGQATSNAMAAAEKIMIAASLLALLFLIIWQVLFIGFWVF